MTTPETMEDEVARGGRLARGGPWVTWTLVLLGLALHLPALGMGFYIDDYVHRLALLGEVPIPTWNLFDFGSYAEWIGTRTQFGPALDGFPYWTDPEWSVRFFRPLSSWVLGLDYTLFGERAYLHHAAGLVWFGLLLAAVHALFRALGFSRWSARVGLVLYSASRATMLPVAWMANRNEVLTALFLCLALLPLVRCGGAHATRASSIALALGAAFLGMLCKESGIVAPVLIAWLLWRAQRRAGGESGSSRRRGAAWIGIALCAALALGHLAFLVSAGYGTNSAFYLTPWHEPLEYLGNLLVVASTGVLGLILPVPADIAGWSAQFAIPMAAAGVVVVALVARWLTVSLRGAAGASFLTLWVVLTVIPQGSALASDRLMFTAAIGMSGLLAQHLERMLAAGRRRRAQGVFVLVGALPALMVLGGTAGLAKTAGQTRAAIVSAEVGSPDLGRRSVFLLQARSAFVPFGMAATWAVERADDRDLTFMALHVGRRAVYWKRTGPRSFELSFPEDPFLSGPWEQVYLARDSRVEAGQIWRRPGFEAEVLAAEEGLVRRIAYRLDDVLENPRLRFLVHRGDELVHLDPPAEIGETHKLPAPEPLAPMMP